MNRTALILFALFGLTMALSNKVHQKTKMIISDRSDCPSNWVGDGMCDDECNTEDNFWDGGDCCGPDVNDWWCWDCECLDPNSEDFGNSGGDDPSDPCTSWYVGDDYCDDECNNEDHDFDGGDCCGDDVETAFCIECACLA